jgi:methylenetetrahydrofolate reductase (NADPH)
MTTALLAPAGSAGGATIDELLATATLEIVPIGKAVESALTLPPGTTVAVTASPAKGQEATVEAAITLARAGLRPVPHLSAHLQESRPAVRRHLERLAAAGITDVFVVGGDGPQLGPLADGLALLEAILEESDAPWRIGIPCYPEGHPRIDDRRLLEALRAKAPHAAYMTSQLSFNPRAVARWLAQRRAEGITLPLHLGLPGATDPLRLLRIAARIGVQDSRRFLAKNSALVGRLLASLGFYRPERLLASFARLVEDPAAGVTGLHLYTFDGVAATARWRQAYLERRRTEGVARVRPEAPTGSAREDGR